MILYKSAFSAEKEIRWDDDIFTVHSDFSDLKDCYLMTTDCIAETLVIDEEEGDEEATKAFMENRNTPPSSIQVTLKGRGLWSPEGHMFLKSK